MDFRRFAELLEATGEFHRLEIKVFLALLSLGRGPRTASEVAGKCGLSTTNAYRYLYSLAEKGIVEFEKNSRKVFWLSGINPFPRVFSFVSRKYLKIKKVFSELADLYSEFETGEVWMGRKKVERWSGTEEFLRIASLVVDASEERVDILAEFLPDDIVILDSLKRAAERGCELRVLTPGLEEGILGILKKIGARTRFHESTQLPLVLVADGKHGVLVENRDPLSGAWFLNQTTDFAGKFEKMWEEAGDL